MLQQNCPINPEPNESVESLQHQLGALAMEFRGNRDEEHRKQVAARYADVVEKLIDTGKWVEALAFEDELPDEWMPQSYRDYWLKP